MSKNDDVRAVAFMVSMVTPQCIVMYDRRACAFIVQSPEWRLSFGEQDTHREAGVLDMVAEVERAIRPGHDFGDEDSER